MADAGGHQKDEAVHNLIRIRPKGDEDAAAQEADAFEQAVAESKSQSEHEAGWKDLVSKKYVNRTLVSGCIQR